MIGITRMSKYTVHTIQDDEEDFQIIREMAKGLEAGDGGNHLMTYHPQGGNNTSQWFHNDDWLDFNSDGWEDIFIAKYDKASQVWFNNGKGGFRTGIH